MAVTKNLVYADSNGVLRTATITIDVEKVAVGSSSDEEQVYLTVSAAGITSKDYWRRNIDKLVEDAIFAASGIDLSTTRYVHKTGEWSAYGDRIVNTGSGIESGESGIVGIRQQLITLAG